MGQVTTTTVVSIVGIAGTLLAALGASWITARFAASGARAERRRQNDAEARMARRQAYALLATALSVGLAATSARIDLMIEMAQDGSQRSQMSGAPERLAAAEERAASQMHAVTDALGLVLIEGPAHVADSASAAAKGVQGLARVMDLWVASGNLHLIADFILHQAESIRTVAADVGRAVESFTLACQQVLHPDDLRPD